MQPSTALSPNGLHKPTPTGTPGAGQSSELNHAADDARGLSSAAGDAGPGATKGAHHPHHHQAHPPARPGPKLAKPMDADLASRLEAMHISTRDDPKSAQPGSGPHAQQGPYGQRQNSSHPGNNSANRNSFSPGAQDFAAAAAAQNGVRLLAALAAGPNMQGLPVPADPQQYRQRQAPPTFHPMGVPLGLPPMPLTPPAAAYGFPAQLSAGHPPMYDFAALQQQHLLEVQVAAAQQAQAQAAQAQAQAQAQQASNAPLSPPLNMTPGISPVGTVRGAPRQSPSDPTAALRDAATLALLQQGVLPPHAFAFPGAFPGTPGFYPSPTDGQYGQDVMAAMARILPQYAAAAVAAATAQAQAQYPGVDMNAVAAMGLGADLHNNGGPSANNRKLGLYKTELCRSWEEKGSCRYGPKCQFAHGEDELRKVQRHPKYKTEICRTFWVSGSCPYGKRCCFIHTELPGPGAAAPGAGGAAPGTPSEPATTPAGNSSVSPPERAPSANSQSDAPEQSQSLLARINAKRKEEESGGITPTTLPTFQFGRPGTAQLRVDTSALESGAPLKQNKSAFPTYASNQTIPAVNTESRRASPPATAGPEFGRQRLEVLGLGKPNGAPSHMRSLSGTDTSTSSLHQSSRSLSGNLTPLASGNTPDSATAPAQAGPATAHGHSRSTSGSHWGPTRNQGGQQQQQGGAHLTALSAFPRGPNETSPWAQAATAAPTSRYPDRSWAQ